MNTPLEPLADLYEQLHGDHDAMRERLLSELRSADARACETTSGQPSKPKGYRQLVGVGAGIAASVILVVTGWIVLYWPLSLTLAQVKSTVADQKWLKLNYEDGEEYWISLQDGRRFRKLPSGRIFLQAPGIWVQYFPGRVSEDSWGLYAESDGEDVGPGRIEESRAGAQVMSQIPKWEPISVWDHVVGAFNDASRSGPDSHIHTERHEVSVQGRRLVRFDTVYVDALGKDRLRSQVWADPTTRLPVRTRKSKSPVGAPRGASDFVEGVFSFPESGPADIHALGAPRDAKIVKVSWRRGRLKDSDYSEEVRELLASAQRAADRFLPRFRIVKWPAEKAVDNRVHIVYWNGLPRRRIADGRSHRDGSSVRIREQQYFSVSDSQMYSNQELDREQRNYYLPLPANLPTVLAWMATQSPASVSVYDGTRTYSLSGTWAALGDKMQPSLNVMRVPTQEAMPFELDWPVKLQWPYVNSYGWGRHELVQNSGASGSDITILRTTREAPHRQRTDYHISPTHDHICLKQVWWHPSGDGWRKIGETQSSDLRQLPNGSWWAAKSRELSFGPDGSATHDRTFLFDISPVPEGDFPMNAFDGATLVNFAERVNASIVAY